MERGVLVELVELEGREYGETELREYGRTERRKDGEGRNYERTEARRGGTTERELWRGRNRLIAGATTKNL